MKSPNPVLIFLEQLHQVCLSLGCIKKVSCTSNLEQQPTPHPSLIYLYQTLASHQSFPPANQSLPKSPPLTHSEDGNILGYCRSGNGHAPGIGWQEIVTFLFGSSQGPGWCSQSSFVESIKAEILRNPWILLTHLRIPLICQNYMRRVCLPIKHWHDLADSVQCG